MSTARKPDLVWAILKGSIIGGRTVADVCRERGERDSTGREVARRLRECLGLSQQANATGFELETSDSELEIELSFFPKGESESESGNTYE